MKRFLPDALTPTTDEESALASLRKFAGSAHEALVKQAFPAFVQSPNCHALIKKMQGESGGSARGEG